MFAVEYFNVFLNRFSCAFGIFETIEKSNGFDFLEFICNQKHTILALQWNTIKTMVYRHSEIRVCKKVKSIINTSLETLPVDNWFDA